MHSQSCDKSLQIRLLDCFNNGLQELDIIPEFYKNMIRIQYMPFNLENYILNNLAAISL